MNVEVVDGELLNLNNFHLFIIHSEKFAFIIHPMEFTKKKP